MVDKDSPTTIDIHYIKANDYREVACDGVVGSATPNDKLWIAFYTERLPLPRIARHELRDDPATSHLSIDPSKPPVVVDGRTGLVRNVEFGLYLSFTSARKLHEWLGSQLESEEKHND